MDFDLGISNTDEKKNVEKEITNNSNKGIDEFIKNLINAKDFEIKINENLLKEFEQFIENDFFEIIMNDEIFDEKQQVEAVREIDSFKWGFLELINKPYLNNKIIIAVSGRFSAGKSSLLNALLDTNLPVDVEATTAIPTYLTYYNQLHKGLIGRFKKNGNYMIVSSKCIVDKPKLMETEFLNYITKENIKNFPLHLSKLIDNFVISMKKSILTNKVIIDTPGIDPADKGKSDYDEVITKNTVSLANVVFWVMDIDEGDLADISLKFLKENISENQDLLVIVNKVDKKPPKEVEKVLTQVKKTLGKHIKAKTLGVIPFSKKDKNLIKSLKSYINNVPAIDTIPEIIERIDVYLQRAREIVVDKILKEKNYLEFNKKLKKDIIENNDYEFLLNQYKYEKNLKIIIEDIKQTYEKDHQEYQKKYNEFFNLFKYENKWFGDDYYYFYKYEKYKFEDKINEITDCFSFYQKTLGYWIGKIEAIENESIEKIEKLETLESKINNAINKFEELKYELKNLV
jgi:predicted GTPase